MWLSEVLRLDAGFIVAGGGPRDSAHHGQVIPIDTQHVPLPYSIVEGTRVELG